MKYINTHKHTQRFMKVSRRTLGSTLMAMLLATPIVEAGYRVPSNFNSLPRLNFGNRSGDDSARLRALISENSSGAVINILNSNTPYELGRVRTADNIHIRFGTNVRILQSTQGNVFELRGVNSSIVGDRNSRAVFEPMGEGGRFRFRAVIATGNARNFLIQGLEVLERRTTFNPIETAAVSNGTIRDIIVRGQGSTGGWGLLQMQAGTNIDLINLNGLGGYTARLEQNAVGNRIDDITGRNLICRNGRAPIALFPNQPNGPVSFRRLRGNRSAYGADIGGRSATNNFSRVTVSNVRNAYGIRDAQYRNFSNDQNPMLVPTPLRSNIARQEGPFVGGPSLGGVRIGTITSRITRLNNVGINRFPQRFYRYRDSNGVRRNMPPVLTESIRREMVADSDR